MARQTEKGSRGKGGGLRGIRVKLITIILALSIIPLVVMTFITARSIHDTVMDLEDQLAEQRTATARGEVLSLIDQTFNGVDVLAKDPTLKQALMDPSEDNLKTARKTLINVQEAFPAGETITFVFNDKGMQIVRADDAELGDISDREYAKKAIEGTKYLSDVVISKVTGKGTIFMAAPIKDDSGKVLGGLAKVANLDDLSVAMGEITNAHTNITVMDRVGSLVASTEEFDSASGELIDLSQEDYFQKAQSGSGMEIIEHNGKMVLATYTKEPNTNWTVVCFADYTTVITPYKRLLRVSMIILVIAVLAVVIIGYLFSSSLANPIVRVMEFARVLAAGDFTTDPLVVNRKDELGEMSASLNDMYANNADVIRNIGEGSSQVSHSSSELSETSQDLLARFEEVASSMERVNDAMTSTGAATEEVSASANEVNESVERLAEETANTKREVIAIEKKAAEIEREGRESSEHAINIAEERGRELEEAAEAAKVVSEIGTMADSIADIANQINLLSLNASIEAARAGEHGRGFAVVAGEINNLASETKSAVEQIQATVDKIQSAFDLLRRSSMELLSFMRETVAPDYEKFITIGQEYGSDARTFGQLADNISEMVHYISESMEQVNAAVAEIAESATNTSSSSAAVTDTIGEAANMMERMSGMANDSQEVSARLDSIVKQFKLSD